VRWFAFDGPDNLDNGLALCVLHHKLFDLGALGLDNTLRIQVSTVFTARTSTGRAVNDLHGQELRPRPGTAVPATEHVSWHRREVFKGGPLAAWPVPTIRTCDGEHHRHALPSPACRTGGCHSW
jgi:putative restriction endonuclease